MISDNYTLTEIPDYRVPKSNAQRHDESVLKWSARFPPPAVGSVVTTQINGIGDGTVIGYFIEYGWLGVRLRLHNPPAWWITENARSTGPLKDQCGLFGAEIEIKEAA